MMSTAKKQILGLIEGFGSEFGVNVEGTIKINIKLETADLDLNDLDYICLEEAEDETKLCVSWIEDETEEIYTEYIKYEDILEFGFSFHNKF